MSRKPTRLVWHGFLVVVIDAVTLLLLALVLPGFLIDGTWSALATAVVVGLFNALIWPVLSRFTLKLSVLSLGLFGLLLNAVLVASAMLAMPWLTISGPPEALAITFTLAIVSSLLSALLAIDEDSSWYLNVVQQQLRVRGSVTETDVPGVVFLEIDGLAHEVLRRAFANGSAPTLAQWVRDESHDFNRWETDWSSQTGACQAGILHGDNHDMPAFRWWEKDRDQAIVTNHPRDAAEIEQRHSDGAGLLSADGASRANILSGDATRSMLTMSTVLERRGQIGRDYAAYFAKPYGVLKTAAFTVIEILNERRSARRQVRTGVEPRIHRGWSYAVMRAWATVIQLDLQVAAVVGDVLAGRSVVYTTFLAYDEVAHHSGIERPDALESLRKVDRQIARVVQAARAAPRPYRFVVLSDHGQSQGATFKQRFGETLEDLVARSSRADEVTTVGGGEDDAHAYLNATVSEASNEDSLTGRTIRRASRRKTDRGDFGPDSSGRREDGAGDGVDRVPELSVMASGCLGLISFPREPGRVTRERLDELHPELIESLRCHPGIGFVLVRSDRDGPVVLGPAGTNYLADGRIEGVDPLAPFGPNAAAHVKRTDSFTHCPDLVVNSTYWEETDEVAAFEELVGSHGGMGGSQSYPFVLHPVDFAWPEREVVGAESVHRLLIDWMSGLGLRQDGAGAADRSPGVEADQESAVVSPGSSRRTSTSGERSAT
ncbi:MAG: phage holin family protein [Solirubrobacterales bacterium]|nr:phage holin family protein [Solirubrobacterales bacterium]